MGRIHCRHGGFPFTVSVVFSWGPCGSGLVLADARCLCAFANFRSKKLTSHKSLAAAAAANASAA